jgi:biotin synthase
MDRNDIKKLYSLPLMDIITHADSVRRKHVGAKMDLCTILNAKSGQCTEDCKYCAQSAHHKTDIQVYALNSVDQIVQAARAAHDIGSHRFGIVTSGCALSHDEVARVAQATRKIRDQIGIAVCGSLGIVTPEDLHLLKQSGMTRYHHNIETSRRFFPHITTTHSFDDRIRTIHAAKAQGMEVCSGGIIGLGETLDDRIDMALCLKELDVDSVPINVLVPIKGTALENQSPLSCDDAIRTIAIFRIVLENKTIRLAAGRESVLKDFQALAFHAGANAMLIGGYLTTRGRSVEEDRKLVREVLASW